MLQTSAVLLSFIAMGLLLQRKTRTADLRGLKLIILNIALPATIFIALISVQFDTRYLLLPVGALLFNLLMLWMTHLSMPLFELHRGSNKYRTAMLLLPSLAPGLSCFPFLSEYLGEDALAFGALADVGNKFFVLILCYLIALKWFENANRTQTASSGRIKSLLLSMLNEPINIVILVALGLVALGYQFDALPIFMQDILLKSAAVMTPLVLLFIGLSVRINRSELKNILLMLSWRSGMAFVLSGLVIWILPGLGIPMTLLIVAFPQSSASFWPFAHMTSFNAMEGKDVFDTKMAISVLACSLPFSTLTILGVFTFKDLFLMPWFTFALGAIFLMLSTAPALIRAAKAIRTEKQEKLQYAD